MRKIGALLLFAAAAGAPYAADAKAPAKHKEPAQQAPWAQEPDGFLGIKFGQPFPDAATLPDCPKDNFNLTNYAPGFLCFEGYGRTSYGNLWGLPNLGFGYTVKVMIDKGMVTSFIVETPSDNFAALAKVLTQRYGAPRSQESGRVQSKAGAEFDNTTLKWSGQRVTIDAEMRSGKVDTAQAYISDKVYWNARTQAEEKATTENASKL
ncbi:MAG: hypothetical protein PW999_07825 [Paraburkholderia tropica]|nr:hypothetical protein [Paraburkholderia tropica]